MRFKLHISIRAHGDIDRNADWWANNHSLEQALHWSEAVYDQLETLREFPESHALSAENDEFPYEIRDKLVGLGPRPRSYRAVFTIKGDTVYVLTVQAAEQDQLKADDIDTVPD